MPEQEQQVNPLDIFFKGSDEEEIPTSEEVVEEAPEKIEEEEIPEEEEEQEEEETEIDYDTPPEPKKKKDETDEDAVENVPASKAVERARIEGRRRKELEAAQREWELERDRLNGELEQLRGKTTELEAVRIKPDEHPDYVSKKETFQKDIKDAFDDFDAPHKNAVLNEFPTFLGKYRAADSDPQRNTALDKLKDELAAKMHGDESITFDSLDKEERREVSAMLRLVKSGVSKADELHTIYDELDKRSKTGTLAVGVREYEERLAETRPILDAVGDLPDEAIETDPYALESVVASIAKTDQGKKLLDAAKRDAIDLIYGLRPLTQGEIEKLESNGKDVKAFQLERQKNLKEKQKKLLPMIVQGLVSRGQFKQMAAELAELKGKKESEESEDDALRKTLRKKPGPKPQEKKADPLEVWFKGS